jgi:phage baseplate assembly protein W
MIGVNNRTGKALSGMDHLKQSINDILTTPLGTRVMRREYGSRLFELIDAPINSSTIIDIVSATADALAKWEPRILVERVEMDDANETGKLALTISAKYLPDGQSIKLDGILLTPVPTQKELPAPVPHNMSVVSRTGTFIRVQTPGYLYILKHDNQSVGVSLS